MTLNDADDAIAQLTQMLTLPSGKSPPFLRADPEWDALRSNPKFQKLERE